VGKISPFGIHIGLELDGRNSQYYPTEGYLMKFNGSYFPRFLANQKHFIMQDLILEVILPLGSFHLPLLH